MLARPRRHALRRRLRGHRSGDHGFTLLEVLVAMGLIGMVMVTVTIFFTRTAATVSQNSGQRTAVQLAADRMEQVRAAETAAGLLGGQDTPQLNGIRYDRDWTVQRCWQRTKPPAGEAVGKCVYSNDEPPAPPAGSWADLVEVAVTVGWSDRSCSGSWCTYRTATLISRSDLEPIFHTATGAS